MAVETLNIFYAQIEDRLGLSFHSDTELRGLWLTRRLTADFLGQISTLLARRAAPEDRFGENVALYEHLSVTTPSADAADRAPAAPAAEPVLPDPAEMVLIRNINVTAGDTAYRLCFGDGAQDAVDVTLPIDDLHRFLHALYKQAHGAGWGLEDRLGWLSQASRVVTAEKPRYLS